MDIVDAHKINNGIVLDTVVENTVDFVVKLGSTFEWEVNKKLLSNMAADNKVDMVARLDSAVEWVVDRMV